MVDFADMDFRSWLSKRTDPRSTVGQANYGNWFSNGITQGRLASISMKIASARNEQEKTTALLEGQAAMVLYSTLIYYIYPSSQAMKRQVDSDPELKDNFNKLKGWFDSNGGPSIADTFYKEMAQEISNRRSG